MTVVALVEEFVEGFAKIELIKIAFLKIHNYFDSLGMFVHLLIPLTLSNINQIFIQLTESHFDSNITYNLKPIIDIVF